MLFGDADVMKTVPVRFRERSEPRTVFHGRRDRVDLGVASSQLDRRFAEHAREGRFAGRGDCAGRLAEAGNAVVAGRILPCMFIAAPLFGCDMQEHGAGLLAFEVTQVIEQIRNRMTVDRPDVTDAELFEEPARQDQVFDRLLKPPDHLVQRFVTRQRKQQPLGGGFEPVVKAP